MKLSRTVGYALQAVLQLAEAEPGTPIPCSRLAAQGRMPERFLLQILRNLVTHGILKSTRGVDGGYMLKRRPEEITFLDLIEAADGPQQVPDLKMDGMPAETMSKLMATLDEVCTAARLQLSGIKLSSLMSRGRKSAHQGPHTLDPGKRKAEGAGMV